MTLGFIVLLLSFSCRELGLLLPLATSTSPPQSFAEEVTLPWAWEPLFHSRGTYIQWLCSFILICLGWDRIQEPIPLEVSWGGLEEAPPTPQTPP